MSVSFFINSKIYEKNSSEWLNLFEKLTDNTLLYVLSSDCSTYRDLRCKNRLKLVPTYSVLRNNSNFLVNTEIAQIDQSNAIISSYLCPNNPKLEPLIRADFEFLCETPHIAGIQLENLEIPLLSPYSGCFCPYCTSLAMNRGIDLAKISEVLNNGAQNGINLNWIQKSFPNWLNFRMESISKLAGKLMVMIRKLNPDIFLGLNVNFSKNPEKFAQDYFFLALYLDSLNFVIDTHLKINGKKIMRQIRSAIKKFLGNITIYMQIKIPNNFNLEKIKNFLTRIQKYSLDGIIYPVSNPNELKKFLCIDF